MQAEALHEGGVDIFLVETIFDTLNAKAAIYALEEFFADKKVRLPVFISGTIVDNSGRTLSGQTNEAFWNSVRHAKPFAIGLNCALGATDMQKYIANLDKCCDCYVFCYPNAGLPNAMGGYDQKGSEMAAEVRNLHCLQQCLTNAFAVLVLFCYCSCMGLLDIVRSSERLRHFGPAAQGMHTQNNCSAMLCHMPCSSMQIKPFCESNLVNAIGGCCGSTASHIAAIKQMASPFSPRKRHGIEHIMRLSGLEPLNYRPDLGNQRRTFLKVGERCNVAGSIMYKKAIVDGNYDKAAAIAVKQVRSCLLVEMGAVVQCFEPCGCSGCYVGDSCHAVDN